MRRTNSSLTCIAALMTLWVVGCSGGSSDGEPHKVPDLKSRGMKDPEKDNMKPAKGDVPGSKK